MAAQSGQDYFHQVVCNNHEYFKVTITVTGGKPPTSWWQCKNCGKFFVPANLEKQKK